jgi:voltage-dependent anion channel protein 2
MSYKDINKSSNDLLGDDYTSKKSLKVKTKTSNGTTFTTEGSLGGIAKLSAKFMHSSGIEFKKLSISTDGRVNLDTKLADTGIDGVSFTVKAEDGKEGSKNPCQKGVVGFSYKMDNFNMDADVDIVNGPVINTSALINYEGFLLGGSVKFNSNYHGDKEGDSSVDDYNAALGYKTKDFAVVGQANKKCTKYNVSYFQQVDSNTSATANVSHGKDTVVTVGGSYSLDADTTVKAKVDSNALVSLAYVQQVQPSVKLTCAATVNANNFAADSHTFGLGLEFSN